MNPLSTALAVQLGIAAWAKWSGRHADDDTLVMRWTRRLPRATVAGALVAADLVIAALVVTPVTARAGGVACVLLLAVGLVASAVSGGQPCGCFGAAPVDRHGRVREIAVKVLMFLEAAPVAVGVSGHWSSGPAALAVGLPLGAVAVPLIRPWRRPSPPTTSARIDRARTALAADPVFAAWRDALLHDDVADIEVTPRHVRFVLEAWIDERPALLIATVSQHGVRVQIVDAVTLAPVERPRPLADSAVG